MGNTKLDLGSFKDIVEEIVKQKPSTIKKSNEYMDDVVSFMNLTVLTTKMIEDSINKTNERLGNVEETAKSALKISDGYEKLMKEDVAHINSRLDNIERHLEKTSPGYRSLANSQ